MKLFKIENYNLIVSEETWGLSAFKKLLDRDKSKGKQIAHAELLFIYFYCDIKSDYLTMPESIRESEIIKDIVGLPKTWKIDKDIQVAIDFYLKFETVIERLYKQALKSAFAIGDYLENSAVLLAERDNAGRPVNDIAKITGAVQKIPKLMSDLKAAYKEVVKEQEDNENKKKGSKSFNQFEDGFE